MKDFTKKGTKLPVIPVGIKFRTNTDRVTKRFISEAHSGSQREKFISYGFEFVGKKVYVKCDEENYKGDRHFLIKLSTIERLAKEQGMCDGCIDFEFIKDWWYMLPSSKNQELRQIYFKNHIGFLGIDRLFFIYKSEINNENMKVKLQENGTVTVTDTETTTTLSKVTVDEICRLVKEDGEKVKLEVGKWYHYIGGLYVWNNGNTTYGFNSQKHFYEHYSFSTSNGAVEATPETVEQYLIEEAVKRGYEKGTKYKHIKFDAVEVLKQPENLKLNIDYNNLTDGCGGSIFDEGVWATIIKPKTITRSEAEKRLGKVITD